MNKWLAIAWVLAGGLVPASEVAAQLRSAGMQLWHQASPGVGIAPEDDARFAETLTTGDYNCDGLHDAAFGMPGDDIVGAEDAGRVLVLYSVAGNTGLSTRNRQTWGQSGPAVAGDPSQSDHFGEALASGDFNNDGCDDLAIGVPDDDVEGILNAGAVNVLYGSAADGLSADNDDYWHQGPGNLGQTLEVADRLGVALAVGDFNADGFDDLAIGAPGEDLGAVLNAGAVHVLFGAQSGLSTTNDVFLRRGTNLAGAPQAFEQIGGVLAAGDVIAVSGDELVIGIPIHDADGLISAGAIMLVSDIAGAAVDVLVTQNSQNVPDIAESGDYFGGVLALGDFDDDGYAEVAVGALGEDLEGPGPERFSAGSVTIIDWTGGGHSLWLQDLLPPEQSETGDRFGSALAAADFDDDGVVDLAIGVSGENLGVLSDAGLVHVVFGRPVTGLDPVNRQLWTQTLDPPAAGDLFGAALAAGPINAGGAADLIIGAPLDSVLVPTTGSATVLYSRLQGILADGFEGGP